MHGKVISIKEQAPKEVTLPDGLYVGKLGGYCITLIVGNTTYELQTEDGIRGIGFNVIVKVENGVATYDYAKN